MTAPRSSLGVPLRLAAFLLLLLCSAGKSGAQKPMEPDQEKGEKSKGEKSKSEKGEKTKSEKAKEKTDDKKTEEKK